MYQVGEKVIYGSHGVCRIVDVEEKTVNRKRVLYYALEPLEQPGARYYIPIENQAAVAKLSKLMTSQELEQLLERAKGMADPWIDDEGRRKTRYKELISSGDREALLGMIHALHKHKRLQEEAGRKFHLCDENFLHDAEKLLRSEFSIVLGIPQEQVAAHITERLK